MLSLTLPGQVPEREPQWLSALQKLQQEMHQAPLGSLDSKFESAWRSALHAARHPQFPMAAQIVSGFYHSQGYELKAEQILRHALALVPDPQSRRMLKNQLAHHLVMIQQLKKALVIREELAKEPSPEAGSELGVLANLYEQMGEFEKAEAAWKEAGASQAGGSTPPPSGTRMISGSFGRLMSGRLMSGNRMGVRNDLAGFYARIGRSAEAEQIYRKSLNEASSPGAWNESAQGYIRFLAQQRRFDEAIKLSGEAMSRSEASSGQDAPQLAFYARENLANLLAQAGRIEESLALQQENVQRAQARNSPEYSQALNSLANALINQNRLEQAEKLVAQMRAADASGGRDPRFNEAMAVQILARIREMQNRPEEATRLRASLGVTDPREPARTVSIHELIAPARQGNLDEVLALADKALALASDRVQTNPAEAASIIDLVHVLMAKGRENDARRIAGATLRILEQASPPDHPRVAEALGSVILPLASLGMMTEAEQVIERQEKILLAVKGSESRSLDAVSHGRMILMQRRSNFAGTLDELKQILARTERRTGPKSRESLYALRGVAFAYPPLNNWSEEERVLLALLERTVNLSGESSLDHAHLLEQMANRASQNGQHDQALAWIDKAIEVTRTLPGAETQAQSLIRGRAQILQKRNAPAGVPSGGSIRWFDKTPLLQ